MTDSKSNQEAEFDRIVHKYYQTLENGESIDPDRFISENPEFADQLRSFFSDVRHLDDVSGVGEQAGTIDLSGTRRSEIVDGLVGPGDALTYVGEYQILAEIARGGMGVVFKARQEKLHRTVALKMILSGRFATELEVDRFRREARSAASLKHPNIVGVYEIGVHEGNHYFTMDYIESVSLSHRLREGSLAPRDAAKLLQTLACATHFAHEKGVLHRDLKPANVLMDSSGQPHITDFGLAKPIANSTEFSDVEITRSGQVVGTPSYMSPEQAAAKHQLVSVASDVYSLGAILYACLSGRAPFVAESTVETLRQVIHDDPLPTRVLNPRVPKDLETICLKCLTKEPRHRYPSAQDLADDLSRFLEGRPVLARPISRVAKIWRFAHRKPGAALATTLTLLIAAVSPPVAVHQYRQSRELGIKAGRITQQKDEIAGHLADKE
ncbi:MAG: serine/threonine protein kinase, partial [Rubripirellula sp.]